MGDLLAVPGSGRDRPAAPRRFPAWLLWLAVHLYYLVGFSTRVIVVMHWAVSFTGRGRSERAISALPDQPTAIPAGQAPKVQARPTSAC